MLPSRLFYDMFDNDMKGMEADIYLKDGAYNIEVNTPGFNKEDIHVECHKGTITIKAEKETKEENDNKKYLRRERKYQSLERSFYLADIEEDTIKAEFKNGVLHLTANIKKEAEKKQITID